MNGGAMDRYVTGATCSNARHFAIADDTIIAPYHDLATKYAIADRYFQPVVGQSSSNDMYLAVARFVFLDNTEEPQTNGHGCSINRTTTLYTGQTTIGDLLLGAQRSFAWYSEGYQAMKDALICPSAPDDCPAHIPTAPCVYDPSDVPFEYYKQFADDPKTMKDYGTFASDVAAHSLPTVAYVKPLQYKSEHPGYGTALSAGVAFVKSVVDLVLGSSYADDTLILLTWDEGGGYFDHVKPPDASPIDNEPYGTRIPLLAIGKFAKKGFVSHVVMEHSSIVKFLEWNFLGGATGQLGARDTVVKGIGSLLDPAATGAEVPE
jgi:phospholipase C